MQKTDVAKRSKALGCLGVLAVVLVLGAALQAYYGKSEPQAADPKVAAERAAYQRDLTTLATGRAAILGLLKDPDSAQFGESIGRVKHGQNVACGSVNARNSFGGMTGWQRFITGTVGRVVLEETYPDGPYAFEEHWNSHCQRSAPRATQKATPKPTKTTTPTTTTRPADPWRAIAVTEPQL